MKKIGLLISALFILFAAGQAVRALSDQTSYPVAYRIVYGTALPLTCNPQAGDVFILTGGPQELFVCTAVNTWTRVIRNSDGTNPAVFTATGLTEVATFTRTDAGHAHIEVINPAGAADFGVGAAGEPHIDSIGAGTEINFRFGGVDALVVSGAGGVLRFTGVTQAALGAPANGTFVYCTDCTVANPCAGGGTGALAKRLNGAWVCN